ncbi:MAG: hypothetical protein WCV71_00910 [Patescibacteria group bacterium]|jgi:hypothetical protein
MQEIGTDKNIDTNLKIKDLPLEDGQNLVNVFVWLIQEDKKQNPEFYQFNKQE